MIQLHDKQFVPFISAKEIEFALTKMVAQIEDDFIDETPVFVGVLNGSFMFAADLLRNVSLPCEVCFIKIKSYEGTTSTGTTTELIGLTADVSNRTVVIVEDIVDTGLTISSLLDQLNASNPSSIKIATLTFKRDAYKLDIPIDYIAMEIPNKFIVGYGLDYDELGRNLPDIYQLFDA